jgi:RHS repeat-associated protein
MIINQAGTVCYDADFFPWGAEQYVHTNTCPQNYKFTGKERDPDMGVDYFGARFYQGAMARFYSTDSKVFTARHFSEPQKWNKYTYVQNNPLLRFDPDGRDDWIVFRTAVDPHTGSEVLAGTHTKEWASAAKAITSQKDDSAGYDPEKFYFIEVTWNNPVGSVVWGNYAVDKATGDLWSAVICEKYSSKRTRVVQQEIRKEIGLANRAYKQIKRLGPICE